MSYKRKHRMEYEVQPWANHLELEGLLNRMTNTEIPWRVEHHRINSDSTSGWTVFLRYVPLNEPLLERTISVGKVYSILNRVLVPGSEESRQFDAAIKEAVRQELD